jgi:hypothetical protein
MFLYTCSILVGEDLWIGNLLFNFVTPFCVGNYDKLWSCHAAVQLVHHLDMKFIYQLDVLANSVLIETQASTTATSKSLP